MKQKNILIRTKSVKTLFEKKLTNITLLATESQSASTFKEKLSSYLHSDEIQNIQVAEAIQNLIVNDGKTIYELSTEKYIKIETISLLWEFLSGHMSPYEEVADDLYIDLYEQFQCLYHKNKYTPSPPKILQWMKRWPSGMEEEVQTIRQQNKERIISLLIYKIQHRNSTGKRYVFPEGICQEEKRILVNKWWKEARFHLSMAIKTPSELNQMMNYSFSAETIQIYAQAQKKEIPIFITPYYLSLLNPTDEGFDDQTIRSYVLYSSELVQTYGQIHGWEKEDTVRQGEPNAAGWLLPDGHNIHRRYPEVAILIPDSMGRACGGLCASCQRMYDFQSKRLNFNFQKLKPKECWEKRLNKLMDYFENDKQLKDILITGGDAFMSQNKTLRNILEAVYKMALRKQKSNLQRKEGEKYAELQRIRLGTRLPAYLPMRIDDELLDILSNFKKKASTIGIEQFIIQTHFQSPLEITPEAQAGIEKIATTGWTITNQLVYNVAASRRGHTAKLRNILNTLGVICYYTFSVKGFKENYAVFTPNSRSLQEQHEEKVLGKLDGNNEKKFLDLYTESKDKASAVKEYCRNNKLPFIATDRNVLNLPGIGKSMTFFTIGITREGKRVLQFKHDHTRLHSPIINHSDTVFIIENKSIWQYLLQMQDIGENIKEYKGIWNYSKGDTEFRFPLFNYPETKFKQTKEYSNLKIVTHDDKDHY